MEIIELLILCVLVAAWIQGLVLSVRASMVITIIAFVLAFGPAFVVFGLAHWITKHDLPAMIAEQTGL